jgi:hypothetical protein
VRDQGIIGPAKSQHTLLLRLILRRDDGMIERRSAVIEMSPMARVLGDVPDRVGHQRMDALSCLITSPTVPDPFLNQTLRRQESTAARILGTFAPLS